MPIFARKTGIPYGDEDEEVVDEKVKALPLLKTVVSANAAMLLR